MFAIILALLVINLRCAHFEDDECDDEYEFDPREEVSGANVGRPKSMEELYEILESNDKVVIYFYQNQCPYCLRIKSSWEGMTNTWNFNRKKIIKFVEIELPTNKQEREQSKFFAFATQKLGSETRPFFAFYKDSKLVAKYQGSNPAELKKYVSKYLG